MKAKIIKADSIVVAPWVSFKCRYGCKHYGRNLGCPPNTPTPKETQELIACYKYALLFQCTIDLRPHLFLNELEQKIFLAGYQKAIGFSFGRCQHCAECNLEGCVKPGIPRPAMEACGIDVFGTVRANDMDIKVLTNREEVPTIYGMVLID